MCDRDDLVGGDAARGQTGGVGGRPRPCDCHVDLLRSQT